VRCRSGYSDAAFLISIRVVECNQYTDKRDNHPDLSTMADQAFILTEQGPLRTIGFVASREWRKRHADEEVLPNVPRYHK